MKPARGAVSAAVTTAVTATVATALLAAAVLVVWAWAAASGPDELLRGAGPAGTTRSDVVTPTPSPSGSASGDPGADDAKNLRPPVVNPWIGRVIAGIGAIGLALLGLLALRWLWRTLRDVERAAPDPEEVDFVPLTAFELAREIVADAPVQRRLLAEGTPRNAIVLCWDRFEQLARNAGLARAEWETPAEFTLRFFDLLEADARPVQVLATLYREARFSDHDLSETDRQAATAAVDAIHRSLGERVP